MKHFIPAHNPMQEQYQSFAQHQAQHFSWVCDTHGVATLTLNRPERKNPLTFASYAEMRDLELDVYRVPPYILR
jgi:enoyl-CoA hydratase/carnithine racemase